METFDYTPPEAMETDNIEVRVAKAIEEFSGNIQNFLERIKSKVEVSGEAKEKIIQRVKKIRSGVLPLLADSAKFGVDYLASFEDFDKQTNYIAQESSVKNTIWAADLGFKFLSKALVDTKQYIEDLNKTGH